MNSSTILIAFGTVLIVSILLSWIFASRNPTIHSFFWGDQKLPSRLTSSLMLSGSFSLNGLLYQTWLGFSIGWSSLLIQIVWCAGFVFLVSNAPRFQKLLSEGTMHGIIGVTFGPTAAKVAALASFLGFSALIGWEAVVGSSVLRNLINTSPSLIYILPVSVAVMAGLYTSAGGLRGNAAVNFFQNILKGLILLTATYFLIDESPSKWFALTNSPAAHIGPINALATLGGIALLANLAFSLFWQVVDMSNWQDLSATLPTNDGRRRTVIESAFLVFVFPGLIGTVIGITLSDFGDRLGQITDTNIITRFIEALSHYPIIGVALVGAYAAAMLSTIDGAALSAAQSGTWDLINRKEVGDVLKLGPKRMPGDIDAKVLAISRLLILLSTGLGAAVVMALVLKFDIDLFSIVYLVVIAQMSLVGPILFCIFGSSENTLVKYGAVPISLALFLGFTSAFAGQIMKIDWLYTFSPVVAIGISILAAWSLPRVFKQDISVPSVS